MVQNTYYGREKGLEKSGFECSCCYSLYFQHAGFFSPCCLSTIDNYGRLMFPSYQLTLNQETWIFLVFPKLACSNTVLKTCSMIQCTNGYYALQPIFTKNFQENSIILFLLCLVQCCVHEVSSYLIHT